jgi:hypothetical protein
MKVIEIIIGIELSEKNIEIESAPPAPKKISL